MGIERITFEELGKLPVEEVREKLQGKYFVFHNVVKGERDNENNYYVALKYESDGFPFSKTFFPCGGMDDNPSLNAYDIIITPRSFVRELLRNGITEVYSSERVPQKFKELWMLDKGEFDYSEDYGHDSQSPAHFENGVLTGDELEEARTTGFNLSFELRKHGIKHHSL